MRGSKQLDSTPAICLPVSGNRSVASFTIVAVGAVIQASYAFSKDFPSCPGAYEIAVHDLAPCVDIASILALSTNFLVSCKAMRRFLVLSPFFEGNVETFTRATMNPDVCVMSRKPCAACTSKSPPSSTFYDEHLVVATESLDGFLPPTTNSSRKKSQVRMVEIASVWLICLD